MTGSVIDIYKEVFHSMFLQEFRSTLEFLYLPKGLESGYQMMGIVIHPKNTKNLLLIFSEFC